MGAIRYTHLPSVTTVPVVGRSERYPVRRVYCVGRNYADHAIEMGIDPRTDPPFFFCKPADTVFAPEDQGEVLEVPYPPQTSNLHHEVELVVAIGEGGRNIDIRRAHEHIFGYAVGIDMTRRDLQLAMRKAGKPWEIGKTFERCAPMSAICPLHLCGRIDQGEIALTVQGQPRQKSDLSKLIWSVSEIIADLSRLYTLRPGDLIFTGTPEGVGPVVPGDTMRASIGGLATLEVKVAAAEADEVAA
ncbi:fumarylacetoacetate hydrolase family protein [uncultured Hydrogenophaga sp.]|uniref:fumarylacetoacetate hydrolase family protein n=1 Tax=uncultured Hydrogenophaga sp. TaxID=199683 RepID=UPI002583B182|nr:fumarylacetoacetate hydrolase family protein [uncultured Hydrogenophaga sp.]